MASVLEMQLGTVNSPDPAAKQEDQASHAASPVHAAAANGSTAKTVVFALAGMVIVIYGLHAASRIGG